MLEGANREKVRKNSTDSSEFVVAIEQHDNQSEFVEQTVRHETDELESLIEALESERGSESIDELVERLDSSSLSQSELEEMAQEAKQNDTVVPCAVAERVETIEGGENDA
jgi:hypothetical protein